MIAYNKIWLDNLYLRNEAALSFRKGQISSGEYDAVREKYPVGFYTPNIFVRIGLFILTIVIAVFSFALLALLLILSNDAAYSAMLILYAFISYGTLEFIIRSKKHFRSGVDDALLWMSGILFISGCCLLHSWPAWLNALIIFLVCAWLCLRFANRIMAALSVLAILAILFFSCSIGGTMVRMILPFLLMMLSIVIYFLGNTTGRRKIKNAYYRECCLVLSVVALVCIYVSGNYYTVRETSHMMFPSDGKPEGSLPMGWIFWIFTILLPVIYIYRGIIKKNIWLIRVGLLLVAAMIFTIRYYHPVLPVETAMIGGGILLLLTAYALISFLQVPKYGFSDEENGEQNEPAVMNLESLAIAQSFDSGLPEDNSSQTRFGGGSGGGGGAGSEF